MTKKIPGTNEDLPKWDVALAALAVEASQKRNQPLTLDDFKRLSEEHSIRFDDIMATMFELVIQGKWSYQPAAGQVQPINRKTINDLYHNRRIRDEDVAPYTGLWQPIES